MLHTPVLIVGGSLVGLSASVFLAWRGVPHIVIEKQRGSSPHPRAMGFTETTLEHYRMAGIADRIPQTPAGTRLRRITVQSLAGEWKNELDWTPGDAGAHAADLSPCTGAAIAQDKLEPILRDAATEGGADLRMGIELLHFVPHEDCVLAHVRDLDSGREYDIAAGYMIAADGAASGVREALGIRRSGVGHLRTIRSVLFHCPGADRWLERGAQQFAIEQDDFRAFLTTYGDSRWVLMFEGDEDRSQDELRAAIRKALGMDLPFDIIATGRWEMAGRIADSYRQGRIFLAGDAAHQLPPTRGGFGANTGIDDVWNLAWKLQRVIAGSSSPALLDSYDSERRPVGWLRHQQTFSRPDYARWVGADFTPDPLFGNEAMEFGQLQRSSAVIGAGPELPAADTVRQWNGQPGTRAAHAWLSEGVSTLDFIGEDFVVFTSDPEWANAAQALNLKTVATGADATLVRPDGVIAWRSAGIADARELRAALHSVAAIGDETSDRPAAPSSQ